jgi:hypothetical protein
MHSRALARSSQYVGPRCGRGGKAYLARGIGYRPRYVARGIRSVLPVIPRIGVKGHQACDFRGFRSPGSAWRNGKQERIFLAQNLLFVNLCASKINAGICVSFSLSFTALVSKCVRVTVGAIGQSVRRGGMWRSE